LKDVYEKIIKRIYLNRKIKNFKHFYSSKKKVLIYYALRRINTPDLRLNFPQYCI
jgi:hypothetical protein